MADFRTHITASSAVGVGVGLLGYSTMGLTVEQSLLGGALCSIGGILPDLDSDSGIPIRETIALSAAVIPMMMIDRLRDFGLERESLVLAGAVMYLVVRFGLAELFKRYTIHRGMWHSIPAAGIAALLIYLITDHDTSPVRLFKSASIAVGFLTHLILDEIWAIDFTHGLPRVKKSFGTALKFWTDRALWPNVSTYAKLILLTLFAFGDPSITEPIRIQRQELNRTASDYFQNWIQQSRLASQSTTNQDTTGESLQPATPTTVQPAVLR